MIGLGQQEVEAEEAPASGQPSAVSASRALELLANRCGVAVSPENAWLAVSTASTAEGTQGWAYSMIQAGRVAGLSCERDDSRCTGGDSGDARTLLELAALGSPALCWAGQRWLVLLGGNARGVELAVIEDDGSEWRRRLSARELGDWLSRHKTIDLHWLRAEAMFPLAGAGMAAPGTLERVLGPGRKAVRRLVSVAKFESRDLWVVAIYAVAVGVSSLVIPVAVQALVNSVALGAALQPLVVLSLLSAVVLGFVAVLQVSQYVVVEMIQRRLFVRVAADFVRRLPRLDLGEDSPSHGPELANRIFDAVSLQKSAAKLLLSGSALVLQMLSGLLLLAFYHPLLLAFDFVLVLSVAVVIFIFGKGALSASLRESKSKYAVAAWLEGVAGSMTARAGGLGDARARAFADARGDQLLRAWLDARGDHFNRLLRQIVGGVGLQVLASATLLGIGGWLVIQRQLTLGQLVAAELVVATLGTGLAKLGKQLETFYDAATSAEKLGQIVDLPVERRGGAVVGRGAGQGLPMTVEITKNGLDGDPVLTLAAGERRVLAGRSRAHSKLCWALYAMCEEGSGAMRVELDGVPAALLDPERTRESVALVLDHEPVLLPTTLLDNLRLGCDLELRRVWSVLRMLDLDAKIEAMGKGLEMRMSPSGAPFDYVERRRLVLARALLRQPNLLILDGALDGLELDAGHREALLDHVFAADAPWTLLVVSDNAEVQARA